MHVLIIAPGVHGPAGAPGSTRTISRSAARPPAPAACPAQLGNYDVVGPFVSIRDAITPHRLAIPVKLKRDEKARPPHPHPRAPRQTEAPVPSEDDDGGARTSEGEGGACRPTKRVYLCRTDPRWRRPPSAPPLITGGLLALRGRRGRPRWFQRGSTLPDDTGARRGPPQS